uniref:Uncharacterized protein n=1 Tax=Avena sativa TaxID=4498 RepID=A0ACD5X1T0_AVESA
MAIRVHRSLLPLVLLLILSGALSAGALRFDLLSGHTKCISDDIKVGTMAVGKYHVVEPEGSSQLPDSHRISLRVTSPYGNSLHYSEHVQSGNFAFTSSEAGDYLACFWAPDHHPPSTITFEFDWRSGVSAKDWSNVAKKGQVDVSAPPSRSKPSLDFYMHLPLRTLCCLEEFEMLGFIASMRLAGFGYQYICNRGIHDSSDPL